METNLNLHPDKICRTCLCESTNMKTLTTKIEGEDRTLLEVLTFVTNFTVNISAKIPKQVCNDCEMIMCKADAFKRRCLESETVINEHLKNINHEHFEIEINGKPQVKHETIESDKLSVKNVFQSSIPLVKPTNAVAVELFGTTKDTKISLFDMPVSSTSKQYLGISEDSNDGPLNEIKIKTLKEESINDFNSQNDLPMDFDHSEAFDTLPIEYKQEKTTVSELKVYSCTCGTMFNKRDSYREHLKANRCSGYKKSMKIKMGKKNSNGGRHITIKRQIICPDCNLEFNTVKACKIHRRKHKIDTDENGEFECSMCKRTFRRKSSYTNHIKTHELNSFVKFTCEKCKREFQHKAHLDNHVLKVHAREKDFVCEICTENFFTEESLESHKQTHKTDKKHQCTLCKKAFYMLSTLTDHMRIHTGEKPFLCSICGRGFSQKTNLAQHMRRHQGLKPFKCEDCDRRFVSKGELTAHTRTHSGAHPFICDDCGSGFTTSSSLVKHRRTHTGERPYACDLCSMRFTASGTLKNHRRTHTGEKPFQCSYCDKAFVQRHDLIAHIRCHTGERPYVCECGQSFRKASALKSHVKMHGKEPLQRDLSLQGANMLRGHCELSYNHV